MKTEWLLTDEEIKQIQIETNNRISRYCNDTEGHFTQTDIDTMYDEGNLGIVHAAVSKAAPLIAQAERERIIANALEVKVDTLRTDRAVVWFDLGYWQFLSGEKGE